MWSVCRLALLVELGRVTIVVNVITVGCLLVAVPLRADQIQQDLGTAGNAASWSVTGAGATGAPAFQVSANGTAGISLTSNGFRDGTFVSGGNLLNFNGYWYADETFSLPADAFDVSLSFDTLYGNDRVVLELNAVPIGNDCNHNLTGVGLMAFPPGPPDVAYAFTGATSGLLTSGFVLGAVNDLRLIVNNSGIADVTAPTSTFKNDNDATDARVNVTLTYSTPEPSTLVLFGICATSLLAFIGRRLSRKERG